MEAPHIVKGGKRLQVFDRTPDRNEMQDDELPDNHQPPGKGGMVPPLQVAKTNLIRVEHEKWYGQKNSTRRLQVGPKTFINWPHDRWPGCWPPRGGAENSAAFGGKTGKLTGIEGTKPDNSTGGGLSDRGSVKGKVTQPHTTVLHLGKGHMGLLKN